MLSFFASQFTLNECQLLISVSFGLHLFPHLKKVQQRILI